jgi:hypothetical protein
MELSPKSILFSLCLLVFGLFSPMPWISNALGATQPQQKKVFEKRVREYLSVMQRASSPGEWAKEAPGLTRSERRTLSQEKRFLEQKLPQLRLEKREGRLFILAPDLEVDVTDGHKQEFSVNGVKIRFDEKTSLFALAQKIAMAGKRPKVGAWYNFKHWTLPFLSVPAFADELTAREACTGEMEFYFRSPHRMYDNTVVWFIPPLTIAGAVLYGGGSIVNSLRNCSRHVEDLRKILTQGSLGLKDVDCGSHGDDRDISIEFWTNEVNHDGTQRTRTMNADFTQALMEEVPPELPEESDPVRAQQRPRVPRNVYVFSPLNSQLQEVRTLADDGERKQCHTTKPNDLTFRILRDEIEPYRSFFNYLGNHQSCQACAREINRSLVSSRPPPYLTAQPIRLPKPITSDELRDVVPRQVRPSGPTAPSPGTPNSTAEADEEDDEEEAPPAVAPSAPVKVPGPPPGAKTAR